METQFDFDLMKEYKGSNEIIDELFEQRLDNEKKEIEMYLKHQKIAHDKNFCTDSSLEIIFAMETILNTLYANNEICLETFNELKKFLSLKSDEILGFKI